MPIVCQKMPETEIFCLLKPTEVYHTHDVYAYDTCILLLVNLFNCGPICFAKTCVTLCLLIKDGCVEVCIKNFHVIFYTIIAVGMTKSFSHFKGTLSSKKRYKSVNEWIRVGLHCSLLTIVNLLKKITNLKLWSCTLRMISCFYDTCSSYYRTKRTQSCFIFHVLKRPVFLFLLLLCFNDTVNMHLLHVYKIFLICIFHYYYSSVV